MFFCKSVLVLLQTQHTHKKINGRSGAAETKTNNQIKRKNLHNERTNQVVVVGIMPTIYWFGGCWHRSEAMNAPGKNTKHISMPFPFRSPEIDCVRAREL